MVRKVLISLLILLLVSISCVPVASALTEDEAMHFFENIYNPLVDKLVQDIPLINTVFGGQNIHIIVEKPGGDIELGAVTNSDGYITELTSGAPENPTLILTTTEAVVERIRVSDNPVEETKEAIKIGEITYEGVGVVESIGVTIVKVVIYFADLFGVI